MPKSYMSNAVLAGRAAKTPAQRHQNFVSILMDGLNFYTKSLLLNFNRADLPLVVYVMETYLAELKMEMNERDEDGLEFIRHNFGTYIASTIIKEKDE